MLVKEHHTHRETQQIGFGPLEWDALPEKKESHVVLARRSATTDKLTWPELNRLFAAHTLEKMQVVFGPFVRDLDPAQFVPPDAEIDAVGGGPPDGNEQPA